MKRLILGSMSTALCLSFSAFAFTPDCSILGTTSGFCSPKLAGGFFGGITGFYLQPSETGLGQATDSWQFIDVATGTDSVFRAEDRSTKPHYKWEWGFNLGYDIPCTSYSLEGSYIHLHNNKHAVNTTNDGSPVSFAPITITNLIFPIDRGEIGAITSLISDAHLIYNLDQGDVKLTRQYVDSCGGFKLAYGLGARYSYLKHQLAFDSPATIDLGPAADIGGRFFGNYSSSFRGLGPMVSLDLHYGVCNGFGLLGRVNGALLVGTVRSHNFLTSELGLVSPVVGPVMTTTNLYNRPNLDHVVPNFDAKVGVDYTYCFCNKSSLTIEAGYFASRYWDCFSLMRGDASSGPADPMAPFVVLGASQRVTDVFTTSFSFRGPYANVTFHL